MSDFDPNFPQEPDITVSVATKTAIRVAVIFIVFYLLQRFADFWTSIPPTLEAIFRTVAVVLIGRSVALSERRKYPQQDLSASAFFSTIFFYGITVVAVYALQIGVILVEIFGHGSMTFSQEMAFVLGIRDFSTMGIVTTFLLAHLPYFAYYWVVRISK